MERKLKRAVTKRYNAMLKAFSGKGVNQGKTNSFYCQQCKQVTKILEVDNGITMHGIECPYCKCDAMGSNYEDLAPNVKPSFAFVRPSLNEVLEEVEKNHIMTANYYLEGGLKKEILSTNVGNA